MLLTLGASMVLPLLVCQSRQKVGCSCAVYKSSMLQANTNMKGMHITQFRLLPTTRGRDDYRCINYWLHDYTEFPVKNLLVDN